MPTADTMPLSIAHLSELDTPPLDYIEFAARAGFASIGLRTNPAAPGGIVYPLATAAEQAELRRRIDATGVQVMYIELIGLSETTRAADYRPMLEVGAAIGATAPRRRRRLGQLRRGRRAHGRDLRPRC